MMGCRSNNLHITRHPIKVTSMKEGGVINTGKWRKPVPGENPTQMARLNFTKFHNLKSRLIKLLRPGNSILMIGLNSQKSSNSSYNPTNDYPTFSANSSTMSLPS